MELITDVQLRKGSKAGELLLSFKYPNRIQGFDHALIAIVEQDEKRDAWSVRPRSVKIAETSPITIQEYAFFNQTTGRWITDPGNTSGIADDIGGRRYLVNLSMHTDLDNVTVNLKFPYGSQVDLKESRTDDDKLEFYALIAIVAKGANKAIALLGDLVETALLREVEAHV